MRRDGRSVICPLLWSHRRFMRLSGLRPQDVDKILSMARQDRTPKGIRDFAILTLLASYGVPAGEIT